MGRQRRVLLQHSNDLEPLHAADFLSADWFSGVDYMYASTHKTRLVSADRKSTVCGALNQAQTSLDE
ncbi:unnamed protein product, partial [Brenthis ino]